ncbi:probable aquaporin TIP4-2 isoform X1 [Aricia agestis]|uniref:probable aquaporin TIP4-2 isoform X1 n=1 Tax=Aricia agestis TaxID=91739 RepID=UPI001C20258B|nr:probable aquaporin TIP4-2 isoform X1 [Aricia agestis]
MSSIVLKCEGVEDGGEGRGEGWSETARACAAELVGTALLVTLLCLQAAAEPAARAAGAGATVSLLVHSLGHVSGAQLNPAVTLAAALRRRQAATRAALEVCAQLAGAALGAAALLLLRPSLLPPCCTLPAPHLTDARAVCAEGVCAGCLVLANLAAWDARHADRQDSWPLRLGAAVAALALAAGELTGASMNPARSFGPALLAGNFASHWVYWAGPVLGSLAATALYGVVWAGPPARLSPPARGDEARPLHE